MGYLEVGQEALQAADDRILQSCNMVYVTETVTEEGTDYWSANGSSLEGSGNVQGLSTPEKDALNSAAAAEGAQGGSGFYINLGDSDNPQWIKADTIAGNNKVMQYLKGATDIAQSKAAADTKLQEGIKTAARAFQ